MLIILAHNKTGTKTDGTSDYEVEVRINERIIAKFEVRGHVRDTGWQPLVKMIAETGESAYEEPRHRGE